MDFSCHTWAFHDLTITEALGTIARLGFRHADLGTGRGFNLNRAMNNPRRAAADIRADLAFYDLDICDFYIMLPRISLGEADRREKELEVFQALMPFASEIGAKGITVSPGIAQGEDEGAYPRTVEALQLMFNAAREVGLPLSIEPHLDSMTPTPQAALKLMEAVEGLQITLDWAQMVCQNIPHDAILGLLSHTRHVQIRQAARNQLQTVFDKGKINLERVIADLLSASYQGAVCVEVMNIAGRHGTAKVDTLRESVRVRDALRDARDLILKTPS